MNSWQFLCIMLITMLEQMLQVQQNAYIRKQMPIMKFHIKPFIYQTCLHTHHSWQHREPIHLPNYLATPSGWKERREDGKSIRQTKKLYKILWLFLIVRCILYSTIDWFFCIELHAYKLMAKFVSSKQTMFQSTEILVSDSLVLDFSQKQTIRERVVGNLWSCLKWD